MLGSADKPPHLQHPTTYHPTTPGSLPGPAPGATRRPGARTVALPHQGVQIHGMSRKRSWHRPLRLFHYWASAAILLTTPVVVGSGLLLQLKKQRAGVQPPTQKGSAATPTLSLQQLLDAASSAPHANISSWDDVDRLDVRPSKGVAKVRANNRWEVQVDTASGEILQTSYRRSDLIESIHDGSFFHEKAKLVVFFPAGIVLLALWLTGSYLFLKPLVLRLRKRQRNP